MSGPQQSVEIDIHNCVLADTDALIAADPCDAWVLRFEAEWADHLAVNQAAVAYIQSIRDKHEAKALADYDRCMGIPETPAAPQPAVHLSISTKGPSGGGVDESAAGLRHAQIVNFGVDPATGGGSCSSIPRSIFCEPSMHMMIGPQDKLELNSGSLANYIVTVGNNPPDAVAESDSTIIQVQAYALFSYPGMWLEFKTVPNMRFGNSLVEKSRITNDALNFKYRLNGVEGAYPTPILHMVIEARRREDGEIRSTSTFQLTAQSFSHTEAGFGALVFSKIEQFYFSLGDTGTWDFYAVPVLLILSDAVGYYYADSENRRLCPDRATTVVGMATYTPGMAGKIITGSPKRVIFLNDVRVDVAGKGIAVTWAAANHTLKPKPKYLLSAAVSITNPLASYVTAMVANNANSGYGGYIALRLYEQDSETTGRKMICDYFGNDGKVYLIDGHQYSNHEFVAAGSWNPSAAIAAIPWDYSETQLTTPGVYCNNTDTVNVPELGAVPKYAGESVAGDTMTVYVHRGSGYGAHSVPVNAILSALYGFDGNTIEFAESDVSGVEFSTAYGMEYVSNVHLTGNAASDGFVSDYIATNYGAHDGLVPRFHGLPMNSDGHTDLTPGSKYFLKVAP